MASTYTVNSGIEKPGSGEQSGTWGATANTNFDIIDRVSNGVGAITLSGTTHTLTTTDGALSDGHHKVLVLGGTPSGTNTITISPNDQDKMYLVTNGTSESAIFTQGSGGNATIAAGKTKLIYADGAGSGAEVTDASSTLVASGTATEISNDSSPQLGGNLDVVTHSIVSTANRNITIAPDGTGDVYLDADTLRVGDSNANATITTNGTGDLTLSTNAGTNSGTIVIADGVNGDISITPNGTGGVAMSKITTPSTLTISGTGETLATFVDNGAVSLYYDDSVKLATTSAGASLTGAFTASGDITAFSDERLKTDISTIAEALAKVQAMRGVTFTKDGQSGSGVIAQELEKIAPELVHENEDYKSVAYGNVVGYLIEAIKELSAQVEDLKNGV